MSFEPVTTVDDAAQAALVERGCALVGATPPERWLLVDVATQRLYLLRGAKAQGYWPVSTAAAGLGSRQDSGCTPPGRHLVDRKIGADAPTGTVFSSREPTGEIWHENKPDSATGDLILTRILTLAGCEPGLNRGPGVDSRARHIYLHGTNDESRLGQPVSHGCIRLGNADIVAVFDQIHEGDPVVIV